MTVAVPGGAPAITFGLLACLVCVTLAITIRARLRTKGTADFYAGGHAFSARQNGFALAGGYLSAASFLGISGVIALSGEDGLLYAAGALVAWVPVLLLAGPMRNAGRFTLADVPAHRARHQGPVRVAGAVSTVTVSLFFLVAQLAGAGALIPPLLGIRPGGTYHGMPAATAEAVAIAAVGALTILYAAFGGMKGTTWVQIVKTALLMTAGLVLTGLVLARLGSHASHLLGSAAHPSGHGFPEPGGTGRPGETLTGRLDVVSLALASVLGAAGLPHVVARVYTVPDDRTARASVNWAIGLAGGFFLMTLALGLGAAALVGRAAIVAQDPAGGAAVPQLARQLGEHLAGRAGGDVLLAVVAAVAVAAVLAVAAGLLLAAATSLAHDVFGRVLMYGRPRERQEVAVARVAAVLVGAAAVALAVLARHLNVAFLAGLALAVAASAHLPAIVLGLFWRRLNATGIVAGIYGGLATAVGLVLCSPVTSGRTDPLTGRGLSLLPPGVDFAWFPLENPALVSIPAGFLCAVAGTYLARERADPARFAALSARAVTGVGAHR